MFLSVCERESGVERRKSSGGGDGAGDAPARGAFPSSMIANGSGGGRNINLLDS